MRSFLTFAWTLLSIFVIHAAPVPTGNPAFADFNTNQFSTTGRKISLLNGAVFTNAVFNNFTVNGITYRFPDTNCLDNQFFAVVHTATNELTFYCTNLIAPNIVVNTIEQLVDSEVPPPGVNFLGYVLDETRGGPFVYLPTATAQSNIFDDYPSTIGPGQWKRSQPSPDIRLQWGAETGFSPTNSTLTAALAIQSTNGYGQVIVSGNLTFLATAAVSLLDNSRIYFEDGAQATGLSLTGNSKTNIAIYGASVIAAVGSTAVPWLALTNCVNVSAQVALSQGYTSYPIVLSGGSGYHFFDSANRENTPQIFGAKGDGVNNDFLAVQSVINFLGSGSTVRIPTGTYRLTSSLVVTQVGLTITGDASAFSYGANGNPNGSRLVFDGVTGNAIALTGATIKLENLIIQAGGASNAVHITQPAGSATVDWLSNLRISEAVQAGVYLGELINSLHMDHVTLFENGTGLMSVGTNSTIWTLANSVIRENTLDGIYIAGGDGVKIDNTVVESNGRYGEWIYKPDGSSQVQGITHDNVWYENNGSNSVFASSQTATNAPGWCTWDHCGFTGSSPSAEDCIRLQDSRSFTFNDCLGYALPVLGTNSLQTSFVNERYRWYSPGALAALGATEFAWNAGLGIPTFYNAIAIKGGSPGANKVLTSDAIGNAAWATPSGSVANPTAQIGLTAVNGVATSAIRSDGAPSLSQAIVPTWTGNHIWSQLLDPPSSGLAPLVIRNTSLVTEDMGVYAGVSQQFVLRDVGGVDRTALTFEVLKGQQWNDAHIAYTYFYVYSNDVPKPMITLDYDKLATAGNLWADGKLLINGGNNSWIGGIGSPEGVVVGSPGDLYSRSNGSAGSSVYVKESGLVTTTGWVALTTASGSGITGSGTANTVLKWTAGTVAGNSGIGDTGSATTFASPITAPSITLTNGASIQGSNSLLLNGDEAVYSSGNSVGFSVNGAAAWVFTANAIAPVVSGTQDLGVLSSTGFYDESHLMGSYYLYNSSESANYQRLRIYSSATNVFNVLPQAAGTANANVSLNLQSLGTGTVQINGVPISGGGITGSGTANTIPKFTGASAIGNSTIADTGSAVTIGLPITIPSLVATNNITALDFTIASGGAWEAAGFSPTAPIFMDGFDINMQAGRITNSTSYNGLIFTDATGVGIDVVDPLAKLHVGSGALLLDNNQPLQWKNHVGTIVDVIKMQSADSSVIFQRGGGAELMRLANSAQVTIGGIAPAAGTLLDVAGIISGDAGLSTSNVRVGGTLKVDTTTTGNVGGGEDNLISYSVPASTLGTDKDFLEFDAFGSFAANANAKRVKAVFGATTLIDSTALIFNGIAWKIHGKIIRTGAATQTATAELTIGGVLLSATATTIAATTAPAETLSGAVTFKCTGEDSGGVPATDAVVQSGMVLKWQPNN